MKKLTTDEFKEKVEKLVGDSYSVIGEYVDSYTKVSMRHNDCGYEWDILPTNFIYKMVRCPKCSYLNRAKTTEAFKKELYEAVGDEYDLLSNYINSKTKVELRHNKCGLEWWVLPTSIISSKSRCPLCSGRMKKETAIFEMEVYNLTHKEYTVLGEYINNRTPIKMRHEKCGFEYKVTPSNFLHRNCRCIWCKDKK